jgi:uncharacterized membrane protein
MIGGLVTGSCFSEYDTSNAISCTFGQIIVAIVFAIPSGIIGVIILIMLSDIFEKKNTGKIIMKTSSKPITKTMFFKDNVLPVPVRTTKQSVLPKSSKVSSKVKPTSPNLSLEILKKRLVCGEITVEEFNELKSILE